MNSSKFALITPMRVDPVSMDNTDYNAARTTWLCPECAFPRPEARSVHFAIQELGPPNNSAINFVTGAGVGIAKGSLLAALGEELVSKFLFRGRLLSMDRKEIQGWNTFIGAFRIVVRGSENVAHRRCPSCGRDVYFATGRKYLFPAPTAGVAIFDAGRGGIVVVEEIANAIPGDLKRELRIDWLDVRDTPLDGLPPF